MAKEQKTLVCEEWFSLSIKEVSTSFGVDSDTIYQIIDQGIVSAKKNEKNQLQFDDEAIRRIRTALRLHRDLGVNFAGAALALELMKEIEYLHGILRG